MELARPQEDLVASVVAEKMWKMLCCLCPEMLSGLQQWVRESESLVCEKWSERSGEEGATLTYLRLESLLRRSENMPRMRETISCASMFSASDSSLDKSALSSNSPVTAL